jgi:Flp pilus assembly protein TadD
LSSIRQLRKRVKEHPDDARAWYDLGVALANDNKLQETHQALRQSLVCNPPPDLAMSIGLSLLGMQDEGGAAEAFHRVCVADPRSVQGRLKLGSLLLRWGRAEQALRPLREAVVLSDHGADACLQYAIACEQCGHIDEAISYYYLAANANPNNTEAHRHLGSILGRQGYHSGAIRAWRRVTDLDPGDLKAKTALGVGLSNRGHHRSAVELLTEVARARPDNAEAFADLGMALSRAGSHDAAIHALKQALKLNPNSPQVRLNYGVALLAANKPEEAMAAFWEVASLAPDWSLAHYNVGLALRELGDLEQARNSLMKATQLDPSDKEVEAALRDTMMQLSRPPDQRQLSWTEAAPTQSAPAPVSSSGTHPSLRSGSITGEIQIFPIVEVLEFLKVHRSTGVLDIRGKSFQGQLRIQNGDLIGGQSPSSADILSILVRLNAITKGDLEVTILDEGEDPLQLGLNMVEDGIISADVLQHAMQIQVETGLIELLNCNEGDFSSSERAPVANGEGPIYPIDTRHALMEVVTKMDEQAKNAQR